MSTPTPVQPYSVGNARPECLFEEGGRHTVRSVFDRSWLVSLSAENRQEKPKLFVDLLRPGHAFSNLRTQQAPVPSAKSVNRHAQSSGGDTHLLRQPLITNRLGIPVQKHRQPVELTGLSCICKLGA